MSSLTLPSFIEAYVTREDWGGGEVKALELPRANFDQMYLHHTVGAMRDYDRDGFLNGDLDDVRRFMKNLQVARPDLGSEVPYSGVLFPGTTPHTAIVAVGRGPGRKGAHTAGQNHHTYALAVAGNTDVDTPMTEGMIQAFRWVAWLWLENPEHALPAKAHQQAPPYYDSKGNNLSATGCPGNNGLRAMPRLQPPYLAPNLNTTVTPPTTRSNTMEYYTNANGRRVLVDLDTQGQLVNCWEKVPGSGQLDSGWHIVVPGRWRSMSGPVQNEAKTMTRFDLVSHEALGEYGRIRTAIFQPTFEGPWETRNADQLDAFLASIK